MKDWRQQMEEDNYFIDREKGRIVATSGGEDSINPWWVKNSLGYKTGLLTPFSDRDLPLSLRIQALMEKDKEE